MSIEDVKPKKQIVSSRAFSQKINNEEALKQALSSHASKASKKLRDQQSVCSYIGVFAKSSRFDNKEVYTSIYGQFQFITPTCDSRELVAAVTNILDNIYKPDVKYAKAGVILFEIYQPDEIQNDLFLQEMSSDYEDSTDLMNLIDELNKKFKPKKTFSKLYL